jgi:hypothetical protein
MLSPEPKFLTWLQTPKPTRPPNLDSIENYLDWIAQEPNGVDGVFIINTITGMLVCRSIAEGHGGHADLGQIVTWAGANVAKDAVGDLGQLLNGGELKYVNYTLDSAVMRLFYLTATNGVPILVGFVGTQPDLMGKLDFFTPSYALRIRDYL